MHTHNSVLQTFIMSTACCPQGYGGAGDDEDFVRALTNSYSDCYDISESWPQKNLDRHPLMQVLILSLINLQIIRRNPVYCLQSTNTPPPSYFQFLFLCLFKVRFAPQGSERGLVRAPQGQIPPQRLEFEEKNEKSKIRGEGICSPRAQHGRVPIVL